VPRWDCVTWGHEVEIGGVRVTTGDAVREGMAPLEAYERFGKF